MVRNFDCLISYRGADVDTNTEIEKFPLEPWDEKNPWLQLRGESGWCNC